MPSLLILSSLFACLAAGQRISPWQEDAVVSKCPLCTYVHSPFTLSYLTRHQRVFAGNLSPPPPIQRPQRPDPCSILSIAYPKTRKIEEMGEGVDYGVKRRASGAGAGKGNSNEKVKDKTLADGRLSQAMLVSNSTHHSGLHIQTVCNALTRLFTCTFQPETDDACSLVTG